MACAWGGFAGYGTAMLLSYFVGQKHYPIDYPLKELGVYFLLTVLLFAGIMLSNSRLGTVPALAVNTALIAVFAAYIIRKDLPLSALAPVRKYIKK